MMVMCNKNKWKGAEFNVFIFSFFFPAQLRAVCYGEEAVPPSSRPLIGKGSSLAEALMA